LGLRIKKLRESLNLSQDEFGRKVGISSGAICGIEKGVRGLKKGIGVDVFLRMSQVFKVDLSWLITGEGKNKETPLIIADLKLKDSFENKYPAFPVVNRVPAGYPDYPLDDEVRYYFYIPNVPKSAFGLIVDGVSMEPELYTGDIVIVNPNQLELKKGEIGVFRYQGGATIKICMPLPGNKGFLLQARNPRSESYIVTSDTECTVIGKVIFKIVKCK